MICPTCSFETKRLRVKEWHSLEPEDWNEQDLGQVVSSLLTPSVTRSLPATWQGPYSGARAAQWISDRDDEGGTTLLVVERASGRPIGLMFLFETESNQLSCIEMRLGYLLAESVWGQGLASELIAGFVVWCGGVDAIASVVGGVERDNYASRRVLEKCGFVELPGVGTEDLFRLPIDR